MLSGLRVGRHLLDYCPPSSLVLAAEESWVRAVCNWATSIILTLITRYYKYPQSMYISVRAKLKLATYMLYNRN